LLPEYRPHPDDVPDMLEIFEAAFESGVASLVECTLLAFRLVHEALGSGKEG
jgi:hypothetical protein